MADDKPNIFKYDPNKIDDAMVINKSSVDHIPITEINASNIDEGVVAEVKESNIEAAKSVLESKGILFRMFPTPDKPIEGPRTTKK